ncbi:hypothetical protein K7X08_018738 [Anisodus acutangulus]|uniref:Uncharacterized protein n=1 Tax=Anisodus acutangulus TaxID=402998 RepID=A0A9Q1LZ23_9SOLA|nr:hypothetical protein K7X08_018738 [Anisodus acutangulus]
MANHGGVGSKFVSVNLNKSYGQSSHHDNKSYSGSYGQTAAAGRGRSGSGGGGMVVLSRHRTMQKIGPKLSVPPPLNLPSLRKEHEKFDLSGSGGGASGGGGQGSGPRPSSSGMGWTKPAAVALQEKDVYTDGQVVDGLDRTGHGIVGINSVSGSYMPPSARVGGIGAAITGPAKAFPLTVEKVSVLRGEDFPSLQAALPVSSGPAIKQKDSLSQKQKQVSGEGSSDEQRDSYNMSSVFDMRPHGHSSRHATGNGLEENGYESHGLSSGRRVDQPRKEDDFFPGPLPLVRLNPRSDWADDERDTGHGFADRGRDIGISKADNYWDRDFDMPRTSVLPHKAAHNQYERRAPRGTLTGNGFYTDQRGDSFSRDLRIPSREGREASTWRNPVLSRDGNVPDVVNDRNAVSAGASIVNKDLGSDNKYVPPHYGDTARDGSSTGNRDYSYGRKDMGFVTDGKQRWNYATESSNSRGVERMTQDRFGSELSGRYKRDGFQNNSGSKSSFASVGKSLPLGGRVLNMGREKRTLSRGERPYSEDPYLKDFESAGFDERDLFSGGLAGVIKRKKDLVKQTDFYDPVRESFEAELERVQKMQELERQRAMEEQERALEQARREEEERQRLIREEEERQRKLEEEAREAAWRAEQERLDAVRRAEEQRIAREEEKRRMFMEEERRKQAAKQKLLELEAKIAKRQAEVPKTDNLALTTDEKVSAMNKEIDVSGTSDVDNWDESERMVERLTTSASFDTPILSRSSDVSSQQYSSREGFTNFPDRGRPINSWRGGDVFENGSSSSMYLRDQDIGHHSPRRDVSAGGRAVPRKDLSGAAGYLASGNYAKGGREGYTDEFGNWKDHRWNVPMDADPYIRNRDMDTEFNDNLADRYGDISWGQSRARGGNTRFPYPDRLYQNSEADEPYSYGKSRYAVRQPRVLPPPSFSTMQRTFSCMNDHPGSSNLVDNEGHYPHPRGGESTRQTEYFGGHPSELVASQQESALAEDTKLNKGMSPRCDSQSSLSVTSPPNSPPHLSHDELDESGDSPSASVAAECKNVNLSGYGCTLLNDNSAKDAMKTASSSLSAMEDEDWSVEDNGELQQQEEYDEDEDGYREEDEVREADDENLDLNQEFEDLQLGEGESSHNLGNLVLGFDEGVEVAIPSDDIERNSRNDGSVFDRPETSEGGSINGVQVDEKCLHPVEGAPGASLDSSSDRVQEAEKSMQESEFRLSTEPHTSAASHLLDGIDAYCGPSVCAQQASSSVGTPSSVGQTSVSSLTSSRPDLPVKLQFGLFSGPSLIPSPVPAIQIGSIQMPLHLHPPVGPSLTHLHPSQPPIFQFGQLRYSSTVSQGILPITAQSMSFGQPNVQVHYNTNQNSGGSVPLQPSQDASTSSLMKDNVQYLSKNEAHGFVVRPGGPHDSKPVQGSAETKALTANIAGIAGASNRKLISESDIQVEAKGLNNADRHMLPSKEKGSDGILSSVQSVSNERNSARGRAQGQAYSNKGKRFTYAVKGFSLRSSFPASDGPYSESSRFQRRPRRTVQQTEFRIRENPDSRQSPSTVFSNDSGHGDKFNHSGRAASAVLAKSGSKRGSFSSKLLKQNVELDSQSANVDPQEVDSGIKPSKDDRRPSLHKSQNISHTGEGNLKRNISEEDVDAPLQSGVVRVFKQPGIEAPSDEDDFIEVRSKRQMLNDRREQREKEIKAKSRVSKPPRKPRTTRQSSAISSSPNKISASVGGETPNKSNYSDIIASEAQGSAYKDVSTGFTAVVLQPLAPIGTPAGSNGSQADKQFHTAKSHQTTSGGGDDLEAGLMFESKKNTENVTSSPLKSWGSAQINQQVMALSQSHLEEAMNPARFEAHAASVGAHSSAVTEPILPSSSILAKDKSFSSAASPINSLLAGEKIQFGAVTSPTVLHTSSRVVSHGIGAPGSNRSEVQISRNISPDESDCALFFEKDKRANDPCLNVQDSEAEAEAAASAVAVAAISSDEIVGNGLGSAISEAKTFEGDQQLSSLSRADESLSVSLPADLNVETPPISLWPPLPSPQNSSSQILSHFPGAPPSHFPFYEMNPVLGGPIFAFGPHKESGGSQSQSQKATVSSSGPLGAWQQCQSSLDSFYGHPAGFTGPFISPPGGIPGVQGPPHMVVYNHFAPVGQYGQVGLSFMGTTYLPSGKQPDWKHTPSSSAMCITEADMNNINMAGSQRNLSNMPATIQHLGPASPIMPMASPLAMFDVSPFQSSPEMPVQARWSHVPASPLHSVPISHPLQQQAEGALPSKFGHGHSVDQSLNTNRFLESHPPKASDGTPSFTIATDANAAQLGVGDSSKSGATGVSAQILVSQSSSGCTNADIGKHDALRNGVSNSCKDQGVSGFKTQNQEKNASSQQNQTAGYNYHRGGGMSQRNMAGNDWSHRRMGFHGRNQSLGAVPSTKVKQIYVAKQTLSGTKNTG